MSKTTFRGYLREKPTSTATPAVSLLAVKFTFDPTAASAGTGKYLPNGAIPLFVQNIDGGATGGTNPTVDIGTSGDDDGFGAETDADGVTGFINTGALLGTALTADTEIYAGVGASAATGGTVTAAVYYIMSDAG